jgi:hypothetical protein
MQHTARADAAAAVAASCGISFVARREIFESKTVREREDKRRERMKGVYCC